MRYQPRDPAALRELIENTPARHVPHTERSLAKQLGVSKSLIGHLKHGNRDTYDEDFAKGIAETYQLPLLDLFMPVTSTSMNGDETP